MNIFEAVRELLDNRSQDYLHAADRAMLVDALNERTAVVANITGGVLQGASANMPVDLYVLDFDVWDADPESKIEVDGSEAVLGQTSADVDPAFVQQVVEAPSLAELEDDDECVRCGDVPPGGTDAGFCDACHEEEGA